MTPNNDQGVAGPFEILSILMFALATMVFLGYLGRLNTAATRITTTARSSARAASLAPTPDAGQDIALNAVARAGLNGLCAGSPIAKYRWAPSAFGTWYGGSATVEVSCVVTNQSLAGILIPGSRTIVVADTQPVDEFRPTP